MKSISVKDFVSEALENLSTVKIPPVNQKLYKRVFESKKVNVTYLVSHQPIVYTPGVLSKFIYCPKEGKIIYNDADEAVFKIFSLNLNLNKTIEKISKEDILQIKQFLKYAYEYCLKILPPKKIENFRLFIEIANKTKEQNFVDYWHQVNSSFLQTFGISIPNEYKKVSEIDVSSLFEWYIENYQEINDQYNEAIRIFKQRMGFYPIKEISSNETPFWTYEGNTRRTVYVNERNVKLIRPKAVAWALIRRYKIYSNVIDILGIGSSYYTFVSDYIAVNQGHVPPETHIISLTIPLESSQTMSSLSNLKSTLNGLKSTLNHNPENIPKIFEKLTSLSSGGWELLDQETQKLSVSIDNLKQKLSSQDLFSLLDQKNHILHDLNDRSNRKIKKELTKKLSEINHLIVSKLDKEIKDIEERLKNLEDKIAKINDVYQTRDYPYFILSPTQILEFIRDLEV
ncbi:MAG: hypothetical protein ABDH21_00255 [bacterium]